MEDKKLDYEKLLQGERVISVRALVRFVIGKWLIILIFAVVFALLLGGYKYYSDSRTLAEPSDEVTIDSLEAQLSEEELEQVRSAASFREKLLQEQKYMKESVYMNLDSLKENRIVLQYMTDNEEEDSTQLYLQYINEGGLTVALADQGQETPSMYLQELIWADQDSDTSISAQSDEEIIAVKPSSFTVVVVQTDEEQCQKLAQDVKTCLAAYQQQLAGENQEAALTLVSENFVQVVDEALWTDTTNMINSISNLETKLDLMTEEFSNTQTSLYEMMSTEDQEDIADSKDTEAAAPVQISISKKYVGLGAAAGIVIAILILAIYYIFRERINTVRELQITYRLDVLGLLKRKKNLLGISRGPVNMEDVAVLRASLQGLSAEAETLVLMGVSDQELWVQELMKEVSCRLVAVENPGTVSAIEALQGANHMLIVVTLGRTSQNSVVEMIQKSMETHTNLLGAVVCE